MSDVVDNKAEHRFELAIDGGIAFATYRLTPQAVISPILRRRAHCAAAASHPSLSGARWS
jgi:hypothetical protein